jgi:hypothetical protein
MNRHPLPPAARHRGNRHDPRVAQAARPVFDALEPRRLMSVAADLPLVVAENTATLRNTTLLVQGSQRADDIQIKVEEVDDAFVLRVDINNKLAGHFSLADVKIIRGYGLGGSDKVVVSDLGGPIEARVYLLGGNGNDSLTSSLSNDTLIGGKGDDLLQSGAGNDWVDGGAQDDRILAGDGKDTVTGGPGADVINTGRGKDRVVGAGSDDQVDTGQAALQGPSRAGGDTGLVIKRRRDPSARANAFNGSVVGLTPQQVREAYQFGDLNDPAYTNRGQGQTIAIVVAYHYSTALNDVNVFSEEFGLPKMTTKTLRTIYASGTRPDTNRAWSAEAALDIQWAHAIAPAAKIIVVEADTNANVDLYRGIGRATKALQPNGGVVAMSFGSAESSLDATQVAYFQNHQTDNVSFVASAGNTGGVVNAPGVDPGVLSVGGTTLTVDADGNRLDETAWMDGGGGTSTVFPRPYYQNNLIVDAVDIGDFRVVPDVAYVGDPTTGVAVYNTTPNASGNTGWDSFGGTSVGAPQWAGLVALANQKRVKGGLDLIGNGQLNNFVYGIARKFYDQTFNDITTGDNTLHPATESFDQATGWGTPKAQALINKLAVANSDAPVSTTERLRFKWEASFIKDNTIAQVFNSVVNLRGTGTARLRPDSADLRFQQDLVTDRPSGGLVVGPDANQIDITALDLERIGTQVVGRGAASVLTFDGYGAFLTVKFVGRVYRQGGVDHVKGTFFAISARGKILKVGQDPVLTGRFVTRGDNF